MVRHPAAQASQGALAVLWPSEERCGGGQLIQAIAATSPWFAPLPHSCGDLPPHLPALRLLLVSRVCGAVPTALTFHGFCPRSGAPGHPVDPSTWDLALCHPAGTQQAVGKGVLALPQRW